MRREYEWVDYLKSIDEDRKQRALTGKGAMVSAREGGIMVQTPERQTTTIKKDVADKIPDAMPLACAEAILEYSPIDVVHKISPRGVAFHRRRRRRRHAGTAVLRSLRKSRRAEKTGPVQKNHPLRHLQRLLRRCRGQRRRLVQPPSQVQQNRNHRKEVGATHEQDFLRRQSAEFRSALEHRKHRQVRPRRPKI
jgi:hypothetical protein